MKTRTETVESIRNEEIRALAKLPQKAALLLAVAMLTTMLASCDEISVDSSIGTTGETSVEDSVASAEPSVEDSAVTDEPYNNGISELYGLTGFFSELSYKDLITNTSNSNYNYVIDNYEKTMKNFKEGKITYSELTSEQSDIIGIGQILSGEKGGVILNIDTNEWNHKIITTENDFFMISQDLASGRSCITGLYDNQFYNELGMNSEESEQLTRSGIEVSGNYDKVVQRLKGEFWGRVLKEAIDENNRDYSGTVEIGMLRSSDNNNITIRIVSIDVLDADGNEVLSMDIKTGYHDEQLKKIVKDALRAPSNETYVTNGEDYPGMVPPHYNEDYTEETWPEEETTEAEIDP